ncbi:MAG TPA: DJ-1/PfpI family protein [Bacteriovoracaceae bacterium]|nr:DJ-1/PfpI family protein [Bacteriovoracaceae bacterium]
MKLLSLLTLILFFSTLSAKAQAQSQRILFMVNRGFNAHEFYVPLEVFKKAGHRVTTATLEASVTLPDHRQLKDFPGVRGDLTFKQINFQDFDAIVFAGGNGSWEDYFPNEDVHRVLTQFMASGKIVALVCASTGLLGVANNLDGQGTPIAAGRNVTGYYKVEGLLRVLGKVRYHPGKKGQPFVVVDRNLITGRDPESAELFAKTVVEELSKK